MRWRITYKDGQTEESGATDIRALLLLVPAGHLGNTEPFWPAFTKGHPDDAIKLERIEE